MNFKGRKLIMASQVFVILAFITGMLLSFISLYPTLGIGERARIIEDLDEFFDHFTPSNNCDAHKRSELDSALALTIDPYEGDYIIGDGKGEIIHSKSGEKGNLKQVISKKYGQIAVQLLEKEIASNDSKSQMEYDQTSLTSYYARCESWNNLTFFYAASYSVAGKELLNTMLFLLLYIVIGCLLLTATSIIIVRKIDRQTKREALIQQDLNTAAIIQKDMLPRGKKSLLQLDIDARLIPAKKVGGDFFCYLLDDGILYFCIGDVSGKGIPASLYMSKGVTLFRSYAKAKLSPAELAINMNDELCINNETNMFITGIVGTVRVLDGLVTYVNAGHESPVIWNGDAESGLEHLLSDGNIPFGIIPNMTFKEEYYQIPENGMLLLYTDGISEAKSGKRGFLGRNTLLNLLEGFKALKAEEINDSLLKIVKDYEAGIEQSDDITLLTLRNISKPKHLRIKNEINELKKIVPFVEDIFKECQLDNKAKMLVRTGLDEALTNCVHYSYDETGKDIEIKAEIIDKVLSFTIKDSGREFNPLEYRPDVTEELKVGGLGISIYRANFDEVRYNREGNFNYLNLIKKL